MNEMIRYGTGIITATNLMQKEFCLTDRCSKFFFNVPVKHLIIGAE